MCVQSNHHEDDDVSKKLMVRRKIIERDTKVRMQILLRENKNQLFNDDGKGCLFVFIIIILTSEIFAEMR